PGLIRGQPRHLYRDATRMPGPAQGRRVRWGPHCYFAPGPADAASPQVTDSVVPGQGAAYDHRGRGVRINADQQRREEAGPVTSTRESAKRQAAREAELSRQLAQQVGDSQVILDRLSAA